MRKTLYICVTRWNIAKEDTKNGILPSDPLGIPRQFVFGLTNRMLHIRFLWLVSQITYKCSVSPRPTCRRVRGSSFLVLLDPLFVHLQNKH